MSDWHFDDKNRLITALERIAEALERNADRPETRWVDADKELERVKPIMARQEAEIAALKQRLFDTDLGVRCSSCGATIYASIAVAGKVYCQQCFANRPPPL